ncbi:carbohydrate-binding module family 13 protein [Rhizophagus irregularis DAOM 181602=DAOM 197198]|nr:carbohydrate-binding module family 13 protein [Rhizophagus irregularis DAOM 181602=DAOM 197198]
MNNNNFLTKLSQNLLDILNDEEYYDVTIEVGGDPYIKIFRAHMVILHYRSNCLRRILSTNKKKHDGTLVHIKLPNILPKIFQIILRYIYGGKISSEEYDTSDIIKILVAGSELGLQELITYLQSFLVENKANWMEQNFDLIYKTSFENDSFLELQKFCTDLTSKEPVKIFKSPNFSSISEKLLVSLIQSDILQMNEIQIWEDVLGWGLAQNPELPSDPTNFSKEDFNALKNSLQHCVPHIRFYNLTSKEFSDKKINIDSNIITIQHTELISKWIDRLENSDEIKNTYNFKLLLRGTRDGFATKKFYEICDNQSRTVTIIKVKHSEEIFGGYNPIEWKSDGSYATTKDSFIFSFKNRDDLQNYILSRVENEGHATYNNYGFGPSFGIDLVLYGYGGKCCKVAYEKKIRESTKLSGLFSVEEYEIFQIIE